VDLTLFRREILGLIGPNGAGKTTLVNALTGFQRLTSGRMHVDSSDITGSSPARLARLGVVRTHQGVRLFRKLTVLENVELGALGIGGGRASARARALRLLDRVSLTHRKDSIAGTLSHGDQRRVGILRALASEPAFILLDEPAAGLAEDETTALGSAIEAVRRDFGCGILVIEHDMRLIMTLCDRVQVVDAGQTLAVGSPRQIQANPAVIEAYLGTPKRQVQDA
jgi:branched-chain amino acid transport system ATP-binding protein